MKDFDKLQYYQDDQDARAAGNTHREAINLVRESLDIILLGGFLFAITSGALTAAIQATAPAWLIIPLAVAFVFAVVVAIAAVNALTMGRRALAAVFEEWLEWQDVQREILKEKLWIDANVTIHGSNNTVALPGSTTTNQNQIATRIEKQLIYVQGLPEQIEGIDVRDWIYFIDRITTQIGHTKRAWLGAIMPSGWKIATFDDYKRLVEPLERAKLLVDRSERSSGRLTVKDSNRIKAVLGIPREAPPGAPADQIEGQAKLIGE